MNFDDDLGPNPFDQQLRSSMGELDQVVGTVSVPDFKPRRPVGGPVLVALLLMVGGFGIWKSSAGPTEIEAAEDGASDATDVTSRALDDQQADQDTEPSDNQGDAAATGTDDPIVVGGSGPGSIVVPITPGRSGWNADGSAMIAYQQGGIHIVVDADTGDVLNTLDLDAADIHQVYWDPIDPRLLHVPVGASFATVDAFTGQRVGDALTVDGCGTLETGLSNRHLTRTPDGKRIIGLRCNPGTPSARLLLVDLDARAVVASLEGDGEAPVLSPSASFVVVVNDTAISVYEPDLSAERFTAPLASEFGITTGPDGDEVIVGYRYDDGDTPASLMLIDPSTGEETILIGPERGDSYPPSGLAMASSPNGVVALWVPGPDESELGGRLERGNLYAVDVSASTVTVQQVAVHGSIGDELGWPEWSDHYFAISDDGTTIAYATTADETAFGPASSNPDRMVTVILNRD